MEIQHQPQQNYEAFTQIQYKQHCTIKHYFSPLVIVCFDQNCAKRGLICSICQMESHKDHLVLPIEKYILQVRKILLQEGKEENNLRNVYIKKERVINNLKALNELFKQFEAKLQQISKQLFSIENDYIQNIEEATKIFSRLIQQNNFYTCNQVEFSVEQFVSDSLKLQEWEDQIESKVKLNSLKFNEKKLDIVTFEQYKRQIDDTNSRINIMKEYFEKQISQINQSFMQLDHGIKSQFIPKIDHKNKQNDIFSRLSQVPKSVKIIKNASDELIGTMRSLGEKSGRHLFATFQNNSMKIWDYQSLKCIKIIQEVKYGIYVQKYNLIVCAKTGTIKVYSMNSFKLIKQMNGHEETIIRLLYDEALDILFSTGNDRKVILWNIQRGEQIFQTPQVESAIYSFTCGQIKNMRLFIFGEQNHNFHIWDIDTKKEVRQQKLDDAIFFVKIMNVNDPQCEQVLVTVATNQINILDGLNLKQIKKLTFESFINSAIIIRDVIVVKFGQLSDILYIQLDAQKDYPKQKAQLYGCQKRYGICWIDKANMLIYNTKSQDNQGDDIYLAYY